MANSVTARFNDNCKVHVAMSDDTTVTKAVIIDADGNETDIGGGGGSSDLSTAKVTINATIEGSPTLSDKAFGAHIEYPEDVQDQYSAIFPDFTGDIILYKNKATIGLDAIFATDSNEIVYEVSTQTPPTTTGNVTYDIETNTFIITGDCTINVTMVPA